MNLKKHFILIFFTLSFLFWSCDYGQLGGADKTGNYYPGNVVFTERMSFLSGVWYSRDSKNKLLDGYRIRKWSDLSDADKAKALSLFPGLSVDNPKTYSSKKVPQNNDYVLLFDDTLYGQQEDDSSGAESWGFGYMGLVREINIFNGDKNRGAIIIEYFEEADPLWLSDQGLERGENPFFGIYYKTLSLNTVQMATAVDLAALYDGRPYYTEKATLDEAISYFNVENEAEFISWGVVIPHGREK
jgi:hypothetical protein